MRHFRGHQAVCQELGERDEDATRAKARDGVTGIIAGRGATYHHDAGVLGRRIARPLPNGRQQ